MIYWYGTQWNLTLLKKYYLITIGKHWIAGTSHIFLQNFYLNQFLFFFIKFKNLKYCESRHNRINSTRSLKKKVAYYVNFLRKTISSILTISAIFHYDPKILISRIDNSECFMFLDALLHEYLPVITIQNGNSWHSDKLLSINRFKHFYANPSFHSCFAALSLIDIDIDMYKKTFGNAMNTII